jgi:hypothetical protein
VILFHRLEDKETIECLDGKNGKAIWKFGYPTAYRDDFGFDEGPRATPAIAGGRVFTFGADGMVQCVDFQSGSNLWSRNLRADYQAAKGFFGIACSPLVEGDRVLLIAGGRGGACIVALDATSGKTAWKSSDDESSYSSPVIAVVGKRKTGLFLTRSALQELDPADGKVLGQFEFKPRIRSSVTAAVPLVIGDRVFLTASYGAGAALLKENGNEFTKEWVSDDALSCHYATPVYRDGFLFGIHGRTDPGMEPPASLRCIEMATRKVKWEKKSFGAATQTLAGDKLLILTERGELVLASASPGGYKEIARAQILSSQVRAHPALADGLFYARSKDQMVCVDLKSSGH